MRRSLRPLCRRRSNKDVRTAVAACFEPLDPRVLMSGDIIATVGNDLNGNGAFDPGEGLAGWTVFLDLNDSGSLDAGDQQLSTDSNGQAHFTGLAANSYDVIEVLKDGWATAPGFKTIDHNSVKDGRTTTSLFLNVQQTNGSIQGNVWNDINGDGVHDATDPGLSGWTVFIDANNNRVLDAGETSATTDASGNYTIPNLAPGSYQLREILQPGWDLTLGVDNGVKVSVPSGGVGHQDFGNFNPAGIGSITGAVWNDVNADGVRAAGDAGLSDWTVFLDLNNNGTLDSGEQSVVSDALGNFSFPSISVGTYHIVEQLQTGWNTSPGHAASQTITVLGGENPATNVQFANFTPTPGSISGTVYNDQNSDGVLGAGESGIPDVTVFVDQNSDGTLNSGEPSTVTDSSGKYSLSGLAAGANVVREVPIVGLTPSAPATAQQLVTVPNGTDVANINFGNHQRTDSAIHGVAFVDSNHNGVRDTGERGIPGITVFLDTNGNGTLDAGEPQTVTSNDLFFTPAVDESGSYSFTHLPAGTYNVRELLPAVLSATPTAVQAQTFDLLPGEDHASNFADVFRPNEIHGIIYNDLNHNHTRDAGETGVGGVTVYIDLNRNNLYDTGEPKTVTAADGSYAFTTGIGPGSYVVRELPFVGDGPTYPTTLGGILWPSGTSNPASGNVTPTGITTSLVEDQTETDHVSITLPLTGSLTDAVDVFLLFDDTGSFTGNSPIVRAAFPQIISQLQTALPGADLAFGVGRLEEYGNFAAEFPTGRPFILNQPVIDQSTPGFSTAIQSALDRTAPGFGGDQPETDIEALYQLATGAGFDGNNNGTTSDSGAAGLVSTQVTPGASGDVPAFSSFTVDPSGNVLPAAGTIGGAGFRPGALPIVLLATDTGFAYQPRGETSITGVNGLTLPISQLTQLSRPTTPFNSGAGIQETITALNALGALVIGLGTNSQTNLDPRQQLESIAKLTGAINKSTVSIPNGTPAPILPGDPLYFQIASGFGASVANGVVSAIENGATSVAVNVSLKASDPRVHIESTPEVVNNVAAGGTAAFDVTFTGDGRPHRFDLQFVRTGTNVVLGSIPVVIGTPIEGDNYEYEDLEEGQIENETDFAEADDGSGHHNSSPSFSKGSDQSIDENSGPHSVSGWATAISAGPASDSGQLLDFIVSDDNPALFTAPPTIAPDGTLSYTLAPGASGSATVTASLHDNGGTLNGGSDTSAATTFTITVAPVALAIAGNFDFNGSALTLDFNQDVASSMSSSLIQLIDLDTNSPVTLPAPNYDPATHRATVNLTPGELADGNYRISIPAGSIPGQTSPFQQDFFVMAGDANRDQHVDTADFVAMATSFGQPGSTFAQGDFNYDGKVNALDFNVIATKFGTTLAPPPPGSTTSLAAAAPSIASLFSRTSISTVASDLLAGSSSVL